MDVGDGAVVVNYSCFYRSIPLDKDVKNIELKFEEKEKTFDPEKFIKVNQIQLNYDEGNFTIWTKNRKI